MRRAAKVDLVQREIVAALQRAGCLTWYIREPFDLLVSRGGRLYLLEVKTLRKQGGRQTLTSAQEKALAAGWPAVVVWDAEQALKAVGLAGRSLPPFNPDLMPPTSTAWFP